jgi:Sec-independent protein translocase protein TatA
MDFLNLGPLELILVAVLAFLVLGPERLVEAASSLGRLVGQLRQTATDLTQEVDRATPRPPPAAPAPREQEPRPPAGTSTPG